jgi:signal transduction histidine kinase
MRKRNEELERLVYSRTQQLESKKVELEKSNSELHEANATKNRFFSMFAHDLRSPFGAILGYLQILNEDFDDLTKEERINYLQSLYSVSKNLFSTIENVLNWFRIEMGRINCEPTLIPLTTVINQVLEVLMANLNSKRIEMIIEVPEETEVFADQVMVKTIFQNLLTNAIKFSEEDGIISISTDSLDNLIEISISDSGKGMYQEDISKLFNKNIIFSTDGTKKEKGTGLGLLICKEFVERNGGTIKVISSLGEGTCFSFTLPKNETVNQ